jgi:aryl-alcohol dehydrogenase-like predicted oxidoreductase
LHVAETIDLGGNLTVRRLGLGTMELTGHGTWGQPRDPKGARALVRRARDLGVDFFDTADSYGPEVSERILADVLHPYGEAVVATKGGFRRDGPSRWSRDGRPEHLRWACEGSLRRLRVDCIRLYQLHVVDPDVPLEESLGSLVELQDEGKIEHIGVCNVSAMDLERALSMTQIVSVQNRYNAGDRGADPVLELCERMRIVFIPWAPLAGGALSGARGPLRRMARRLGATPAQVALAWLLHTSPLMLPIPGTRAIQHLEENVRSMMLHLEPDDLADLAPPVTVKPGARRLVRRVRRRARRLLGR